MGRDRCSDSVDSDSGHLRRRLNCCDTASSIFEEFREPDCVRLVLKEKAAIASRSIVGSPQPRTRWGHAKAKSKIQRPGARVVERKAEILLAFVGAWFEDGLRIRVLASKGRHRLVNTAGGVYQK